MIVLVRHGRTASNASGLLLGRSDPPLDATGRAQAALTASALVSLLGRVDRIVSSPLLRTSETAATIAAGVAASGIAGPSAHATAPEFDDRFLELDYGEWDGRPVADVTAEEWARWRSDLEFAPPDGESHAELGERVRRGLDDLSEAAVDSNIVVVTHVSPIKAGVAWAIGAGDELAWKLFVSPASITTIAVANGSRSLHGFNERSHLAAL